jgi:hypothetical protein
LTGTSNDCSTNIAAVDTAVRRVANYPTMAVTVCYLNGNNQPASEVRVTVSYPFVPLFSFGFAAPTIRAASQGRIVF